MLRSKLEYTTFYLMAAHTNFCSRNFNKVLLKKYLFNEFVDCISIKKITQFLLCSHLEDQNHRHN
jgi:hypothetical protein